MHVWDIYFSSLAAMTLHPGYQKPGTHIWTLEDCADLADVMMRIRLCRLQRLESQQVERSSEEL